MKTPLMQALGFALFHFLWQGAVLALPLAACRASSKMRYAVACLVLFAMPLAFFVTLALALPGHYARFPVTIGSAPLREAAHRAAISMPSGSLLTRLADTARWLVPFWLVGVALFWLRGAAGWVAVQRIRFTAAVPSSGQWRIRVGELASGMGIRRAIALLESHLVDVPVTIGFLRPAILVPAGILTGLPADQLEFLLIHELTHIRRFDYSVNLLQRAVEGLLFYHPAVWWVSHVLRTERENCCDDAVLATRDSNPHRYASALAALEQSRCFAAQASSGGDLKARIRRVLWRRQPTGAPAASLLISALLIVSGALLLSAFQTAPPTNAAQTQSGTVWEKWLNEDVLYIVSRAERTAFLNLTTDPERERFIEQFWLRRDPTPGTPENEYKQEHYRRIAYSNAHFSDSGPGWKTDRARVYIVYGPPDEIDADSSCTAGNPAHEEWLYRFMEGLGQNVTLSFSDAHCTGRYALLNPGLYRLPAGH